jgi:hypothetical protein
MGTGKPNKNRLRVCRVVDVPLREVSGICSRRSWNGRMFLIAVDDRVAKPGQDGRACLAGVTSHPIVLHKHQRLEVVVPMHTPPIAGKGLKNHRLGVHMRCSERAAASAPSPGNP